MSALLGLAAWQSSWSWHTLQLHRLGQSAASLPACASKLPCHWNHDLVGQGTGVSFILLQLGSSPSLPIALSSAKWKFCSLTPHQAGSSWPLPYWWFPILKNTSAKQEGFVCFARWRYEGSVCSDHGKSGHNVVLYWLISRWGSCTSLAELCMKLSRVQNKSLNSCSSAGKKSSAYWSWMLHPVHGTFWNVLFTHRAFWALEVTHEHKSQYI